MSPAPSLPHRLRLWGASALASLLAACAGPVAPPAPSGPVATPAPAPAPAPAAPRVDMAPAPAPAVAASQAGNERAYRRDAAAHLYRLNSERIFQGRLPPLLYAIGVMQVELDARGQVRSFGWLRAPRHAPEVMAEIERTVRRAAPYPQPARLGRVVYTETWLWDKSGRFQLDTLTEGQN